MCQEVQEVKNGRQQAGKVAVNDYRNWLEKSWRGVALGGGLVTTQSRKLGGGYTSVGVDAAEQQGLAGGCD